MVRYGCKGNGPAGGATPRDPAHRRKNPTVDEVRVARHARDDHAEYWEQLAEMERLRGRQLLPSEVEALTRAYYADQYRADLARISPEAWDEYHRDLEDEDGLTGV